MIKSKRKVIYLLLRSLIIRVLLLTGSGGFGGGGVQSQRSAQAFTTPLSNIRTKTTSLPVPVFVPLPMHVPILKQKTKLNAVMDFSLLGGIVVTTSNVGQGMGLPQLNALSLPFAFSATASTTTTSQLLCHHHSPPSVTNIQFIDNILASSTFWSVTVMVSIISLLLIWENSVHTLDKNFHLQLNLFSIRCWVKSVDLDSLDCF